MSLVVWPGLRLVAAAAPKQMPFKLGIITDEITGKLEAALDFITSYSLSYCELREIWQKNIMTLSQQELGQIKELTARHHLHVSDIASPIFKYDLPEMPAPPEKRDEFRASFTEQDTEKLLHQSFEIAHFLGTEKVRIFSYWRVNDPEKAYPYMRDRLAKAAELAGRNGIILVLENEHTCNVGTGRELGRLVRDINSRHLRGNWDPGNAAMLKEIPYPDGYREVAGLFTHMHIKDVKRDPSSGKLSWAPVGVGLIDWRGQLKAVLDARYSGTMSLETHYRRPDGNTVESTRESLAGLLRIVQELS